MGLILGKGQVKKGHQIKMLHECCATHVLWVLGAQNSMVTSIFEFGLRKGQCQVKLGQIRSNFQIQNRLTKTCLYYPVLPQNSKSVIYFHISKLEMPKIAIQRSGSITFRYLLFYHGTAKDKILLWNVAYVLFVRSSITYIQFFGQPQSFGFYRILFWKIEILNFFVVKLEKYKKYEIAIL